jgi:hypothetical protein
MYDDRSMKQDSQIMALLKKVWPFINRALNVSFYFVLSIVKNSIKGAIDQIKGSF